MDRVHLPIPQGHYYRVELLAEGPPVGCTWGGSRGYGPAFPTNTHPQPSQCGTVARWSVCDAEHGWFLCERHLDRTGLAAGVESGHG